MMMAETIDRNAAVLAAHAEIKKSNPPNWELIAGRVADALLNLPVAVPPAPADWTKRAGHRIALWIIRGMSLATSVAADEATAIITDCAPAIPPPGSDHTERAREIIEAELIGEDATPALLVPTAVINRLVRNVAAALSVSAPPSSDHEGRAREIVDEFWSALPLDFIGTGSGEGADEEEQRTKLLVVSDIAAALSAAAPAPVGSAIDSVESLMLQRVWADKPQDDPELARAQTAEIWVKQTIKELRKVSVPPSPTADDECQPDLIDRGAARIAIDKLAVIIGPMKNAGYEERAAHNNGVYKALAVVENLPSAQATTTTKEEG